jgi:hypothetical protein
MRIGENGPPHANPSLAPAMNPTDFFQDLRIGARVLLKEKSFCFLAASVLALGICSVTTMFSVVNATMLRGFSFPNATRIAGVQVIDVTQKNANANGFGGQIFTLDYEAMREQQKSFEMLAAYIPGATVNATVNGNPRRYNGAYVSFDFFRILGVAPSIGRNFAQRDDRAGAEKVVLISHQLWVRDFGGEDVIGKSIRVNGKPATVVGVISRTLAKKHMRRAFARDVLCAFIAQGAHIDAMEKLFPLAEQDRPDRKVQFVDQARAQILPNGGRTAPNADVSPARRSPRLFQGGVDALGDKPKLRAARHRERRSPVMGQHEDGCVVWRLVAPPALPALIGPRAPNGTKHISADDPRSDVGESELCDLVVDAGVATSLSVHLLKHARVKEPFHQFRAINSERILEVLPRPGAEAVDRDSDA